MSEKLYSEKEIILELRNGLNESKEILNFLSLGLSEKVAMGFRDAFEATLSQCTLETKRQAWRYIRFLCEFLSNTESIKISPLRHNIIIEFGLWLDGKKFSDRYKSSIINQIQSLVLWCSRNYNGIVDKEIRVISTKFKRKNQVGVSKICLGENDIRAILSAAYEEIDEITYRLTRVRESLARGRASGIFREVVDLLRNFEEDGKFKISQKKMLTLSLAIRQRVAALGGVQRLGTFLYPSVRDVFAFYLAVLCQCSGNPMSMRILTRDCVVPHPIRTDRQRIIWSKIRSGREQKADFNVARRRSAPNLIRTLNELTDQALQFAGPHDQNKIFLAFSRGKARPPSWQTLHNCLDEFIERHKLPPFDFKDLRRAGANLHQKASGSILSAKSRLNHRSSRTTRLYVAEDNLQEFQDQIIGRSQGALLTLLEENNVSKDHVESRQTPALAVQTVFGFDCKDPFAGISPGSKPGQLCTKFCQCATCPGSVVTLDDIALVSRLLKTAEHLREARKRAIDEGWMQRFDAVYASTLHVLEQDLLPRVTNRTMKAALAITAAYPVPYLE